MNLFHYGNFKSAAGLDLKWKIECDALTQQDLTAIAAIASPMLGSFGIVKGVPRGGQQLATAFWPHAVYASPIRLIVDDVWTTGKSLYNYVNTLNLTEDDRWIGFVIFAREPTPERITSLFTLNPGAK